MIVRIHQILFLFIVATGFAGCGTDPVTVDDNSSAIHQALKPKLTNHVATVSYPLQYLTQRIVGSDIKVDFTVGHRPTDQNWQPTEADVAILQQADLVIVNGPGATYANWLSRVSVSDSRVCNSCSDLALQDFVMVEDHKIVHQHGPEGEHSHPYMVAYTWLDPAIAKKQAKKILKDVAKTYPERAADFDSNYQALANDLDELSELLTSVGANNEKQVVSINPLFKFMTRAANVTDHHLLWLSNDDDGTRKRQLEKKLEEIRGDSISKLVFLIPANGAYGLEKSLGKNYAVELNLSPCFLDTLDQSPDSGDYLSVMRTNIDSLIMTLHQSAVEQKP